MKNWKGSAAEEMCRVAGCTAVIWAAMIGLHQIHSVFCPIQPYSPDAVLLTYYGGIGAIFNVERGVWVLLELWFQLVILALSVVVVVFAVGGILFSFRSLASFVAINGLLFFWFDWSIGWFGMRNQGEFPDLSVSIGPNIHVAHSEFEVATDLVFLSVCVLCCLWLYYWFQRERRLESA
jgi:hypothetical protein